MLYETAARSAEVLRLNVEDLDLANRRARVVRKGGAADVITWSTSTARLLPRLLKGRKSGPVFVTERKARVQLPAGGKGRYWRCAGIHWSPRRHWRGLGAPAGPGRHRGSDARGGRQGMAASRRSPDRGRDPSWGSAAECLGRFHRAAAAC
jgi:integrase